MRKTDEQLKEQIKKVSKVDERKDKIRILVEKIKKMDMEKFKEFSLDLKNKWNLTNKEFEVRIDGANLDVDRLAMSLLWDKNSRKEILMKEINHPRRKGSHTWGLAEGFIMGSEELMVCYVTALKNNENLIEELNYFIELSFEIIKEQAVIIEKLEKDIENMKAPRDLWEDQYKIQVYNELKRKWGDKIGYRIGVMKQAIEKSVGDSEIVKKRKKEIMDEQYEKIKGEIGN